MAIVQISRITQRKGLAVDLPNPLAGGELGWVTDERRLWIGNGTLADGAPVVGNTEVLTEFSDILSYATQYTYQGTDFGLLPPVQTGLTSGSPVQQSLQSRLDSIAIITNFGATGDGTTDVTANINNALYQLFCQDAANPSVRRSLYFPAGTYKISNTLKIPPHCSLYGDGPESTIISFEVPAWIDSITYEAEVLVEDSGSYYRSVGKVPIGIDIANTTYWTPTVLPSYIARTADSLQQVGANIGLDTNILPGSFEISNMKFTTDQIMNGFYVEAAQDCSFLSVNISGPETLATLTTSTNDTACVRWNSTAAVICNNIEWNHSTFSGMVYGTSTNDIEAAEIRGVTFSNCMFEVLYQGVYLGSDSPPMNYVGPTGVRITANNFDSIYAEGVVIINAGPNCSAYNAFYDVGNHFSQTLTPATPIINIDGTNNVSIGDMFQRPTSDSTGLNPRIKLNNLNSITLGMNISNMTLYQNDTADATLANQMAVGTYQRLAGITDTLTISGSAQTLFTFDAVYTAAVKIDYTIVSDSGGAVRTGTYTIVRGTDGSGTNLTSDDTGFENSSTGVTFSESETGSVVSWQYTTTTTGTISYSVTKLA